MQRSLDDTMALMLSRSLNERFGESLVVIRLQETPVGTCGKCDGLLEIAGDVCTQCGNMDEQLSEDDAIDQVSPPGREKQVKALKKKKGIKNPWAVAWASKNRSQD